MIKSNNKGIHKLIKLLFFGACIGLLISAIFLLPWFYNYSKKIKKESYQQSNLINASGLAFESFQTFPVEITALNDGVPIAGMSVSADGYRWYTPQEGKIKLQLAKGAIKPKAAYQNRILTCDYIVLPNDENRIVFDMKDAPKASEIVFHTLKYGKSAIFSLDIENADEVSLENAPNGIEMKNNNGTFSLAIDGSMQQYGFYHFTLVSTNVKGSATTEFCLTVPRETEPIIIKTVEELTSMKNNLAGNYILANDLDFSGVTDWPRIGTEEYPFIGTFDGGGHTIYGYTVTGEADHAGIFNFCKNAIIKNLIIKDPYIDCVAPEKNYGYVWLSGTITSCYVENCAAFGGFIKTTGNGGASGLSYICDNSVVMSCFNSVSVINGTDNHLLPGTGGIATTLDNNSYILHCGNEGDMKSDFLTGGIVGCQKGGVINQVWSTGYIAGMPMVGEFPPGGIIQTMDAGRLTHGYFLKGASAKAGNVFISGAIIDMKPIDKATFRDKTLITSIGTFDGENPDWAYASLDAYGPIPYGVFKEQAASPNILVNDGIVEIRPIEGVKYFYSTDGTNPYISCESSVDKIKLSLKTGQVLKVFAAQPGMRDSEIIEFARGGFGE